MSARQSVGQDGSRRGMAWPGKACLNLMVGSPPCVRVSSRLSKNTEYHWRLPTSCDQVTAMYCTLGGYRVLDDFSLA